MSAPVRDLTVAQVAVALNCAAKTVCKLAKTGKLRGYRLGRDWRFEAAEVNAFRRRREQAVPMVSQRPRAKAHSGGHLPGWYDFDHGGRPS
jgi:excisionase family DNA binding protein